MSGKGAKGLIMGKTSSSKDKDKDKKKPISRSSRAGLQNMPPRGAPVARGRGRGEGRGRGQGRGRGRGRGQRIQAGQGIGALVDDVPAAAGVSQEQGSHAGAGLEVPLGAPHMAEVQSEAPSVPQLGMVDPQMWMQQMAAMFAGGMQASQPTTPYEKFRMMNPPTYSGTTDTEEVEKFLHENEKIFEVMQLNEDKTRVLLAAFQLEGAAADWWSTVKESRGASMLTWDAFKERFRDYFFPQSLRDAKLDEFLNLTQGPMSVLDFGRKFTSLAKYAKELAFTERTKCRQFEKGLRPAIRNWIVPLGLDEYKVLIDRAMAVEKNLADTMAQNEARQGKAQRQESRPTKRQREHVYGAQTQQFQQGSIGPSQSAATRVPAQSPIICHNCRQLGHRQFNCLFKGGPVGFENRTEVKICYNCGQPGHVQRRCPQRQGNGSTMRPPQPAQSVQSNRPAGSQSVQTQFQRGTQGGAQQYQMGVPSGVQQHQGAQGGSQQGQRGGRPPTVLAQGRVFTVAQNDGRVEPIVTRGTFLIYATKSTVLVDIGASHSFIAAPFLSAFKLSMDELIPPLQVETPIGGHSVLNRVCKGCEITIRDEASGHEHLSVFDLIVLDMKSFDVILGMNWLSVYQAMIDCFKGRVTLITLEGDRLQFSGDRCGPQILPSLDGQGRVDLCSLFACMALEDEDDEKVELP